VLKLRHLFRNDELAGMLLACWEHDEPAPQLFDRFRISANAIYPFRRAGCTCFLRCAPASEKSVEAVTAEIDFVGFLLGNGYRAPRPIAARDGREVVCAETPWGSWIATAFEAVPGRQLEDLPLDDPLLRGWGAHLGKLHALSSCYDPHGVRRWSHRDVLGWVRRTLTEQGGHDAALAEADLLQRRLDAMPRYPTTYGLVHYDFELDNVFHDPATGAWSAIDFDDAMYHWYAVDVEQALDSLAEGVGPECIARGRTAFLEGYRGAFTLPEPMLAELPTFRRFADLYGYARVVWSIGETWDNEPAWMRRLRERLAGILAHRSTRFGTPLGC
jgi:Ser/Thr protein kinase RdoA (MazF antagonist)